MTIAGVVLVPVGLWAALEPFLFGGWGWSWDTGRYLLTVFPGAAAMLGGLVMLTGRKRAVAIGGGLALAAGLWFVTAPIVHSIFVGTTLGSLSGGESVRMLQWMPFFFGAGALISLLSAYGLGLIAPMQFADEAWTEQPTSSKRRRVPATPERARRQRGVEERAAGRTSSQARSKRSAQRKS